MKEQGLGGQESGVFCRGTSGQLYQEVSGSKTWAILVEKHEIYAYNPYPCVQSRLLINYHICLYYTDLTIHQRSYCDGLEGSLTYVPNVRDRRAI